jgi:F-type H+-transporting ATPase subunit epsilon
VAATFHLSVVTPEREVLALEARFVALPAYDGEMGFLPRRAPLLVQLGAGQLRIEAADGAKRSLFVAGGFAQMVEDRLTLLTEEATEPARLSAAAARRTLAEVQAESPRGDEAWRRKQRTQDRARAVLRLTR